MPENDNTILGRTQVLHSNLSRSYEQTKKEKKERKCETYIIHFIYIIGQEKTESFFIIAINLNET